MPDAAPDPQSLTEALTYYDRWLAFNQRYQRIPGVQAAVHAGDRVAFSAAYGLADVEGEVALTEQHLFRIASHSKTFTATAVLQLVEQGRLRLDDKASAHVTEIVGTPLGERTLRDLLNHVGGVTRDSQDADFWQLDKAFPDRDELLAVLRAETSAVLPGNERFKYSNIGYGLLGLVIEAVTGTSYNEHVRTAIIDKLGLDDLGPELEPERAGQYATGYSALAYADSRVPIEHVDTRALAAATGFYGTARDLVTYFSAHLPGDARLLTDDSKRQMQHPHWATDDDDWPRYGLGFQIVKVDDRALFGHGGGYPGHITRTLVDPGRRVVVSALTNAIDGPANALAEAAHRLIELALSAERGTGANLERFTGRFANLWGVQDVVLLGGRLYVLDPTAANPTDKPVEVAADGDTLRVTAGSGYGAYGESYRYTFGPDGRPAVVRGASGLQSRPIEQFSLPGRVTVS